MMATSMDQVTEDVGGTVGEHSYSEVLQGTVKVDSKPIFLKEADVFGTYKVTKEQWLTNVELYKCLGAEVPFDAILGIQRAGSLWRLYIEDITNRVRLLSKGVSLRGMNIPLYEKNPYIPDRTDHIRIRIKNIPLSADDSIIVKALKDSGCELIENPSREKLRVDGKLTNCETGDRIVFIKPRNEPLPKIMKMGIFRATVIHSGQNVSTRSQTCGKCLQTSHRTAECMNDWVCKRCKISGHKSGDCPMTITDNDDESQENDDQTSENEAKALPQSIAAGSIEHAGNQPTVPVASPKNPRLNAKDKLKSSNTTLKSIQDYFKASSQTPKPTGDVKQKHSVRHSPPTPDDVLQAQKKTKMQGLNSSAASHESDTDTDDT